MAIGVRLLLLATLATAATAADDAEFAFNLLSDIAPVLALFGEQFARQFMSESLTWFDHLIFAMVPLGIITAITGAIRVHGPQVARSFIGRARENRALAEIELMSSTSDEVCELFNGSSIVRAMGKPKITEFIIFPETYDTLETLYKDFDSYRLGSESEPKDKSCGIHSLDSAENVGLMTRGRFQSRTVTLAQKHSKQILQFLGKIMSHKKAPESNVNVEMQHLQESTTAKSKTDSSETELPPPGPPNLQLNLSSDYYDQGRLKKGHEIILAAIAAVLIQIGLLAIAGVTALYLDPESHRFLESKVYGLPCYVAGSVLLSIGTGLCSIIVEHSTIEHSWETVKEGNNQTNINQVPRLVWLQQKHTVNDQGFNGYVILAGSKKRVITSRRNPIQRRQPSRLSATRPLQVPSSLVDKKEEVVIPVLSQRIFGLKNTTRLWELLTVAAAFFAGVGFTAQFMGLRGLAFPCSIAHLLAIFVMALIRAAVRRRLGRLPAHSVALSGYELDFLATQIVLSSDFRTFNWCKEKESRPEGDKHPARFACNWRVNAPEPTRPTPFLFRSIESAAILQSPEIPRQLHPERYPRDNNTLPTSQQLVRVRDRLGDLCAWTSKSSESALSLAQSIEAFMETFFPTSKEEEGDEEEDQMQSLTWLIETTCLTPTETSERPDFIKIPVARETIRGERIGNWKVDIGKVDAALSLWMASIESKGFPNDHSTSELRCSVKSSAQTSPDWRRTKAGDDPKYNFCRIIGDNLKDEALKQDISWWVDSLVADQSDPRIKNSDSANDDRQRWNPARNDGIDLVIGYSGTSSHAIAWELAITSKACLSTILAQHLFTSFMWTVAKKLPRNALSMDQLEIKVEGFMNWNSYNFSKNWLRPKLSHRKLTKTVRTIESHGLGNETDILLCMVPPLSSHTLLPNSAILKYMPRVSPNQSWLETAACYNELLGTIKTDRVDKKDTFSVTILIEVMDFLVLASEPYDELTMPPRGLRDELRSIIAKLIAPRFARIIKAIAPVYRLQGRRETFKRVFKSFGDLKGMRQFVKRLENNDELEEEFAKDVLKFTNDHFQLFKPDLDLEEKLSFVAEIVEQEDRLEQQDIFGWTPYNYACILDDSIQRSTYLWAFEERAERLMRLIDKLGYTPIHIAAREGNLAILKRAFKGLSDVMKENFAGASGIDGMTYLHLTSKTGSLACFELIDPWVKQSLPRTDVWGRQPLHIASKSGHDDIIIKLLKMGSSFDQVDDTGNTPLDHFVDSRKGGKEAYGEFCRIAMENPAHRYGNGKTFLHCAVKIADETTILTLLDKFDIDTKDDDGHTALHHAILAHRTTIAISLINGKLGDHPVQAANPSVPDVRNMTPLIMAVRENLVLVTEALVDVLKFDVAHQNTLDGRTLLHHAGGREVAKFLIARGCDPLAKDSGGKTALHVAIARQNKDVALYLSSKKFLGRLQANPFDDAGESLLIAACKHGVSSLVRTILKEFTGLLNKEDPQFGLPPISWACKNGHASVVKILIDHGMLDNGRVEVNKIVDMSYMVDREEFNQFDSYSPLHFAIRANSVSCLKHLLRHPNVDITQKDDRENTPLELAVENSYREAARKLLLHKDTSDTERVDFIKKFVSFSSHKLYYLVSDVLLSMQDKSLVHSFMLWLADEMATGHLPASLTSFVKHLRKGALPEFNFPYHLAVLLGDPDLIDLLKDQNVPEQPDEDGWSWADYAKRFGKNRSFERVVNSIQHLEGVALSNPKMPTALVLPTSQDSIRLTTCQATSDHGHGICNQIQHIRVIKESQESKKLCLRSDHCIPPGMKYFYFEIKVLHSSSSMSLGIGFCGSSNNDRDMPGWRDRSWGYHGDDGNLFIEAGRGTEPSKDFGANGQFRSNDVVGVCLNMKTGDGFCTRNGKRLNMGNAFRTQNRRFDYGKLYPCVGFDVASSGVGLHFMVNFGSSSFHPFTYQGPFDFE
ncbi:hypothetical protein SNK03_012925 [Fusarium graminearum]